MAAFFEQRGQEVAEVRVQAEVFNHAVVQKAMCQEAQYFGQIPRHLRVGPLQRQRLHRLLQTGEKGLLREQAHVGVDVRTQRHAVDVLDRRLQERAHVYRTPTRRTDERTMEKLVKHLSHHFLFDVLRSGKGPLLEPDTAQAVKTAN